MIQHLELLLKEARRGKIQSFVSVFNGGNQYGAETCLADPYDNETILFMIGQLEKKKMQLLEILLCDDD